MGETTIRERSAILFEWIDELRNHREELSQLEPIDCGGTDYPSQEEVEGDQARKERSIIQTLGLEALEHDRRSKRCTRTSRYLSSLLYQNYIHNTRNSQ